MMPRLSWFPVSLLLAGALFSPMACDSSDASADALDTRDPALEVGVRPVTRGEVPELIRQSGFTRAKGRLTLTSEVQGKVRRRHYDENDVITARRGATLYEVDFVDTAITAPVGWRILRLFYEEGEVIQRYTKVAELINYDTVIIDFQVTQREFLALRALPAEKRVARFTIDGRAGAARGRSDASGGAQPGFFTAPVVRVFPAVDPATRKYRVEAEYANPPGASGNRGDPNIVYPDLLVDCVVPLGARSALKVPAGAIREEFGQTLVFVVLKDSSGKTVARSAVVEVTGDFTDGPWLFVRRLEGGSPLEEGSLVVTRGIENVRDGAVVLVR